ncbi:hypothetical protein GH733_019075 [Mirounga leonina]|nr:hypothetical protein GH733_019075 [Mirounga leonina]
MGLSLNEEEIRANMALVPGASVQGLVARPSSMNYMVAPVTGNNVGIRREEIKQGCSTFESSFEDAAAS